MSIPAPFAAKSAAGTLTQEQNIASSATMTEAATTRVV
jgi:hypothetical protein